MLREARRLAGESTRSVRWIRSPLSRAPLRGPYDLITAGESLHWTDWRVAFGRMKAALVPDGRLAIVARAFPEQPWDEDLRELVARYGTNRGIRPFVLVEELEARGLFLPEGRWESRPIRLVRRPERYIEALHSSKGLSRDRMSPASVRGFDRRILELVGDHLVGGRLSITFRVTVEYGRPRAGEA
jgi:hypothetical protein